MNKSLNITIVDDNRNTSSIIKENLSMEYSDNNIQVNIYDTINGINDKILINSDFLLIDYNLGEDINGITLAEQYVGKGFKGVIMLITGEGGFIVKTKLKFSEIKDFYYIEKNADLLDKVINIINDNL